MVVVLVSWVQLFAPPQTIACQAPLSMDSPVKNTVVSGHSFPSPEDLPNPGTELRCPVLQADSLPSELQRSPCIYYKVK